MTQTEDKNKKLDKLKVRKANICYTIATLKAKQKQIERKINEFEQEFTYINHQIMCMKNQKNEVSSIENLICDSD